MKREILCTLGPSSMNDKVIPRLEELGVSLFRINLSHTKLDDLPRLIEYVKSRTKVPVCLDSEGAQIRTGDLAPRVIQVRENDRIRCHRDRVPGDRSNINLYPLEIVDALRVGDLISIDFNSVLTQVVSRGSGYADLRVLHGGQIGQNRAVTVERDIVMPPLTAKDAAALTIGRQMGITHVALSFANTPGDVDAMRSVAGPHVFLISKIESLNGLRHIDAIAAKSEALLIDRGDLSRQVPIEQIPAVQKAIIKRGKDANVRVYVATNLLESMVSTGTPTRAEVNDIYNTLLDGVDGLVLAAETAIGKYPIDCVRMVAKLIHEFESADRWATSLEPTRPLSFLPTPHGGQLVLRDRLSLDRSELLSLKLLRVSEEVLIDCENLATGVYSPLSGFMDAETLRCVLKDNRLPGGEAWTMPIALQVSREDALGLKVGDRIVLADKSNRSRALLDLRHIHFLDLESVLEDWFQTSSRNHPGVARLLQAGSALLGGDVQLVEGSGASSRPFALTPAQCRFVFTYKGWQRVIGLQPGAVPRGVVEGVRWNDLESTHADGVYLCAAVDGDEPVTAVTLGTYETTLASSGYPHDKVLVGNGWSYPRFAGPREAVFDAICSKNRGCSYALINLGGQLNERREAEKRVRSLFDALDGIGVTPLFGT